jgi:hypothetical protein
VSRKHFGLNFTFFTLSHSVPMVRFRGTDSMRSSRSRQPIEHAMRTTQGHFLYCTDVSVSEHFATSQTQEILSSSSPLLCQSVSILSHAAPLPSVTGDAHSHNSGHPLPLRSIPSLRHPTSCSLARHTCLGLYLQICWPDTTPLLQPASIPSRGTLRMPLITDHSPCPHSFPHRARHAATCRSPRPVQSRTSTTP